MGREEYFNMWIAGKGVPSHVPGDMMDLYTRLFVYYDAERVRYASALSSHNGLLTGITPAKTGTDGLGVELCAVISEGLRSLADAIRVERPGPGYEALIAKAQANPFIIGEWIGSVLSRSRDRVSVAAEELSMETDSFYFFLMNWFKPFFVSWRIASGRSFGESGDSGLCPFCGMYPDIALLSKEKEGRRYLHCALCEQRWPYPRLKCFHCGNDDQDRLWMLHEEGTDRRIDCCDECGAYIKTIVADRSVSVDDIDPIVENAMSGDLDSAALERGYGRP